MKLRKPTLSWLTAALLVTAFIGCDRITSSDEYPDSTSEVRTINFNNLNDTAEILIEGTSFGVAEFETLSDYQIVPVGQNLVDLSQVPVVDTLYAPRPFFFENDRKYTVYSIGSGSRVAVRVMEDNQFPSIENNVRVRFLNGIISGGNLDFYVVYDSAADSAAVSAATAASVPFASDVVFDNERDSFIAYASFERESANTILAVTTTGSNSVVAFHEFTLEPGVNYTAVGYTDYNTDERRIAVIREN